MFIKYRNENMRRNFLEEIGAVDHNAAVALAQAPFPNIQIYVKQYNDHIAAVTGMPLPQIAGMQPTNPLMGMPIMQPQ